MASMRCLRLGSVKELVGGVAWLGLWLGGAGRAFGAEAQEAKVEGIINAMDQEIRGLRCVEFSFHQTFSRAATRQSAAGKVVLDVAQGFEWADIEAQMGAETGKATTRRVKSVVGADGSGEWDVGSSALAQWYVHKDVRHQSADEVFRMGGAGQFHPEFYLYGDGRETLPDLYRRFQKEYGSKVRWEVADSPGGEKRLLCFISGDGGIVAAATMTFFLGGGPRYVVTKLEDRMPYEPYPLLRVVEVTKQGNDVWMPEVVTETQLKLTRPGEKQAEPPEEEAKTVWEISEGRYVDGAGRFTMESLGMPVGQMIVRGGSEGGRDLVRKTEGGVEVDKSMAVAAPVVAEAAPAEPTQVASVAAVGAGGMDRSSIVMWWVLAGAGVLGLGVLGVIVWMGKSEVGKK